MTSVRSSPCFLAILACLAALLSGCQSADAVAVRATPAAGAAADVAPDAPVLRPWNDKQDLPPGGSALWVRATPELLARPYPLEIRWDSRMGRYVAIPYYATPTLATLIAHKAFEIEPPVSIWDQRFPTDDHPPVFYVTRPAPGPQDD